MKSWMLLLLCFTSVCFAHPLNHAEKQYVAHLSKRYHLNQRYLTDLLQQAKLQPHVIKSINHPFEEQPYDVYAHHFLNQSRIQGGVQYWKAHAHVLSRVAKQYHVDPSVIIAVLGVETLYGKGIGNYQELGALDTLAFYRKKRAHYFRNELTQFLLMSHDQGIAELNTRGSYAGALGIPQFMPSSYRAYGVDYTGNHHIDLMHNQDDAIASVANYLKQAGWQYHQPIAVRTTAFHILLSPAEKIRLCEHQGPAYWAIYPNFKAIKRYNPSNDYALAVTQLSEIIKANYERQTHSTSA